MRAHSQPLIVTVAGGMGQTCAALEPLPLQASGSGLYDEAWLQRLIQDNPALLPIADLEPGFSPLIPVCMELPVPSGYIDNLMVTPDGGIVVVETKLWRNPQAPREVVGQILDYAKDLAGLSYEDLEHKVGISLKRRDTRLFILVSAVVPDLDEARFIDAVSRNLKLGRFLLIIAGDGIQESAEQLADFVQRHVGLHFTLALVEMSLWRLPGEERIVVLPRIIARTVEIERAIVRIESGIVVEPVAQAATGTATPRAQTLSEAQFDEALAHVGADLPGRLHAFIAGLADQGLFADVRRNLSLKWRGPDGQDYHLGSISLNGTVGTDYCNWSPNAIGRIDLSHAYLTDLAALLPSGSIRQTAKPTGWRVVVPTGDPPLGLLLDHHEGWAAAIDRFISALRKAIPA